jgi:ribosomal-protein-alanine N-acetyltransferase
MKIQLKACTAGDADELYAFECDNRRYFEQSIPSRGDDYYVPDIFRERHAALLEEQKHGSSVYFLIKNETGSILGRINLVDRNSIDKSAQLGYRIGQSHTGKGIAKEAVRLLIMHCQKFYIDKVEAKTTDGNFASQKILTHNGFRRVNKEEVVVLHGHRMMLIHYIWAR